MKLFIHCMYMISIFVSISAMDLVAVNKKFVAGKLREWHSNDLVKTTDFINLNASNLEEWMNLNSAAKLVFNRFKNDKKSLFELQKIKQLADTFKEAKERSIVEKRVSELDIIRCVMLASEKKSSPSGHIVLKYTFDKGSVTITLNGAINGAIAHTIHRVEKRIQEYHSKKE